MSAVHYCQLLTATELARLLRRSPVSIKRDVSRRPGTLPPFVRPGKTPLWPLHVIETWLREHQCGDFPDDFRFFVTGEASQGGMPSLAAMLETANAPTQKKKGKK